MTQPIFVPRKRRTREHVIADQSIHHVEGFILDEGHTAQRLSSDYGYDLVLFTYDEKGYIEPHSVYFQVKAAENLTMVGDAFAFDLDIRDYNLWIQEKAPVILILFDASRRRAYWLHIHGYFSADMNREPKKGAKTVRVRVPKRQLVNQRAISRIRDLKWAEYRQTIGVKR